jgi:hypothetical protein
MGIKAEVTASNAPSDFHKEIDTKTPPATLHRSELFALSPRQQVFDDADEYCSR